MSGGESYKSEFFSKGIDLEADPTKFSLDTPLTSEEQSSLLRAGRKITKTEKGYRDGTWHKTSEVFDIGNEFYDPNTGARMEGLRDKYNLMVQQQKKKNEEYAKYVAESQQRQGRQATILTAPSATTVLGK